MRRNDFFKSLLFGGGNPASRSELETETLPYTFSTQPKTLKNYRIYGNTVNGESVGDETPNLFNANSEWNINASINKNTYAFPQIIGDNRGCFFMIVEPSTTYTISCDKRGDRLAVMGYNTVFDPTSINANRPVFPDAILKELVNFDYDSALTVQFKTQSNTKIVGVYYAMERQPINLKIVEGSKIPTYKIPVTVNEHTTNIYLDEPLANSNDIADYIDYKLQKRFNADGTSEDVALPEITVFDNENEISFGTTVQPSKIYLKGGISENEVTVSRQIQPLRTMRSLQPLSLDGDLQLDVMPTESDLQLDVIIPTANLNRIEDDENAE